jgi:hypothetical protein
MIDVAMGIEALVPAAEYFGSTTANTKECFDNLNWLDSRTKPTWEQVQSAWVILEPQLIAEAEAKAAQRQSSTTSTTRHYRRTSKTFTFLIKEHCGWS